MTYKLTGARVIESFGTILQICVYDVSVGRIGSVRTRCKWVTSDVFTFCQHEHFVIYVQRLKVFKR